MEGEELGVGQPREGDEEKGGSEKDEGGLEGIPAVLYLLPSSDVEVRFLIQSVNPHHSPYPSLSQV